MKNSMTVIFENEAEAYKALSDFRRDPLNGDYAIANAAVVKRNGESLSVMDGFEMPVGMNNSSKGWIIGMITGIFFGFYAMFMGACLGCLIGVFFGADSFLRAFGNANTAADASVGINNQLAVTFMKSINRAYICARFAFNATVINNRNHFISP